MYTLFNWAQLLQPQFYVENGGLWLLLFVVFAETGLFVGFFLPGDSLLFVAGIAASGSAEKIVGTHIPFINLAIGAPIAAIIGSQLGHYLGVKVGPAYFERPDGKVFNKKRVDQTSKWLNRYGTGKALILSRFVPIVRTLINPMAGIVHVPAKKFFVYNAVGAVIWTETVMAIGLVLGDKLSGSVDRYLLPIIALIIFISVIPVLIELLRSRSNH